MRMLICVGMLFLLYAQPVSSLSEAKQKHIVEIFNKFRAWFANGMKISNMNELKYNSSLEREVPTCAIADKHFNREDHRVLYMHSLDELKVDPKHVITAKDRAEILEGKHPDSLFVLRPNNPIHTGIGCVQMFERCKFTFDPEKEARSRMPRRSEREEEMYMCFFGPENIDPMSKLKRGDAGTECSNGKSNVSKSLCKVKS